MKKEEIIQIKKGEKMKNTQKQAQENSTKNVKIAEYALFKTIGH